MDRETAGTPVSTEIVIAAEFEVSPKLDTAQSVIEVIPSGAVHVQEDEPHSTPRFDSMAVILYPPTGSLPEAVRTAVPRHQPPLPGCEQATELEIVAAGYEMVCDTPVHPGCPGEQDSVLLPVLVMLQVMVEPQVPGQPEPHAVDALLKYPATLPVPGQEPGDE